MRVGFLFHNFNPKRLKGVKLGKNILKIYVLRFWVLALGSELRSIIKSQFQF